MCFVHELWEEKLFGPSFDYILFLRPRQWPILTFQLMVGILTEMGSKGEESSRLRSRR